MPHFFSRKCGVSDSWPTPASAVFSPRPGPLVSQPESRDTRINTGCQMRLTQWIFNFGAPGPHPESVCPRPESVCNAPAHATTDTGIGAASATETSPESAKASAPSQVPPAAVPAASGWTTVDRQGRLMAREAVAAGRPLDHHKPVAHAARLLLWCQTEGVCAEGGDGYDIAFPDLTIEYLTMCDALGWMPAAWCAIGQHFAPLTGGKKYRNAFDERTGARTARQRFYKIPAVVVVAKPRSPCAMIEVECQHQARQPQRLAA